MAFFDKLTDAAAAVGDKAGEVIETTKLKSKINGERKAMESDLAQIGRYYYDLRESGEELPEKVLEFCASIDQHLQVITETEETLQQIGNTDPSL
ncbi:hypothetical protein M2140_000671 [Clostridiales Family XIII bacterium PM5-7]